MTREMSAMKAQIAQLSNMLKMSLDIQMDIQRSIRQEVAAAVNQANAASTTTGWSTIQWCTIFILPTDVLYFSVFTSESV